MGNSFFIPGNFSCPIYCRTRDKTDEHNIRGREFLETLWRDYAAFLDPDALQRATQNLPTVFWELYVAHALHNSGISLQPQARTKQNKKGPDLFAADPDIWIEAVMPDMGIGPDAMEYQELGTAYKVPVDPFILRVRSAFETKARLMVEYAKAKIIQRGQATVIAIGGCMLTGIGDGIPPRIVRAILGVGSQVLHLDRNTREVVDRSIEHRDVVEKKNKAIVKTNPFLDPAYAHVSAVIYSACNWVSHPDLPGGDFTVIYNENANVTLPHGWLQEAEEFWREEDQLRSVRAPKRA